MHRPNMQEKIKSFCCDMRFFLKMFLPKSGVEKLLFSGLFIFYYCIGLYMAFTTSIIDHPVLETDLYLSFDNPLILKYGRSQINGHPLMYIFFYPFVIIGNLIASIVGFKAKTLLFLMLSSSMISMSCVYIYRYIYEIVELKKKLSLLFSIFYAFFSTNLILGFTPESFSLSAFFLTFSVYYYSYFIKNNTLPSFSSTAILSCICLGGVTITNFVKGVIPVIYLKDTKINIVKRILGLGLIFFGIILFIHIALQLVDGRNYFYMILFHKDEFSSYKMDIGYQYWNVVFSKFWGSPILFPEVINNTFLVRSVHRIIRSVDVIDYAFWWQYAYMGVLTCMVIVSFIKNYANKFVQILFLLLSVDIIIHCVYQFGFSWPFIYGGHWVYCVPLLLAWLYKSFKKSILNIFYYVICGMTIFLIVNNLIRLFEFAEVAKDMYPFIK